MTNPNFREKSQHQPDSLLERYGRIVSYAQPCEGVSLASFLAHANGQPRFYWENKQEEIAFVGSGNAIELIGWGEKRFTQIQQQAQELFSNITLLNDTADPLATPRLFGGFSFRNDFVPDNAWSGFGSAHFVLPHYQLVSIHGQKWLTINVQLSKDESVNTIRAELIEALNERLDLLIAIEDDPIELAQAPLLETVFPMPYAQWEANILSAKRQIDVKAIEKVVLARTCETRFSANPNLDSALRYLADHYSESYRFLFEPQHHNAFYGATPELLIRVEGQAISTMALAGSIQRGATPEEDAQLAQTLLNDPKERHEHQLVIKQITDKLSGISDSLFIGKTDTYKLRNIQHIHTPITGTLKEAVGVLPVVELLHPTPALGGSPREKAMEIIGELEPFPRGWYAAPLGWLDYQLNGQFVVAIRSAVCQNKRISMYAGAGIVADSQPQKEWDETNLKFKPMLNALGIAGLTND